MYEKLCTKQTSTAATTEFLGKITNRKKISNKHFNLCEAEISLDEIINLLILKQIINTHVMMSLQQSFINLFQMK